MQTQKNAANSLKTFYSIAFTALFFIHFLFLYNNSRPSQIEWLEVLKLAGPVIFLNVALYTSNGVRSRILSFGFLFLCGHAVYGIVEGALEGLSGFISDDGRFMITSLGRGAGETAWAFCAFIVLIDFCVDNKQIPLNNNIKLAALIGSVAIIIYSQSRGAMVFIGLYYFIYKFELFLKLLKNPLYLAMALIVIVGIIYAPSIEAVIARSSTSDSFLTGREYIWSAHIDQLKRLDLQNLLFGLDLEPKIVEVPEIGYVTADPHNVYIDIINYYGIAGFLIMVIIYRKNVVKSRRSKAVLWAFACMGMLVSPFRYAAIFYLNVLVLLIPTVSERVSQSRSLVLRRRLNPNFV